MIRRPGPRGTRALPTTVSRIALLTLLVACSRDGHDAGRSLDTLDAAASNAPVAARSAATGADSLHLSRAERALRDWLDDAREPAPDDTVVAPPLDVHRSMCDDGGTYFPSPLLARYELLSSELRGDTVVVRASVTTVAEQDVDRRARDRFAARQRVRTDVLEWDVVPVDSGWAVCNGIRFGYRGADSLTTWTPSGASLHSARMLADSVRR